MVAWKEMACFLEGLQDDLSVGVTFKKFIYCNFYAFTNFFVYGCGGEFLELSIGGCAYL